MLCWPQTFGGLRLVYSQITGVLPSDTNGDESDWVRQFRVQSGSPELLSIGSWQVHLGGRPNPTFPYFSILMGLFFNMLMTFNEQKITAGQPGIFLQLFSSSLLSCFHRLSPSFLLTLVS